MTFHHPSIYLPNKFLTNHQPSFHQVPHLSPSIFPPSSPPITIHLPTKFQPITIHLSTFQVRPITVTLSPFIQRHVKSVAYHHTSIIQHPEQKRTLPYCMLLYDGRQLDNQPQEKVVWGSPETVDGIWFLKI